MKYVLFSLLVVALIFAGCSDSKLPTEQGTSGIPQPLEKGTQTGTCTWEYNLTAGQTIPVGKITVWNDATNLYVKYTLTDPCWQFGTLHLWVGNDLTTLPRTDGNRNCPDGVPIPGQFPYQHNAAGLTEYTFTVPFSSLNITDVNSVCRLPLYFVPHAEVINTCGGEDQTAFGGNEPGNCNRWYFYDTYPICCDEEPPTPTCKTAFAKGGYVFVTDKKSNPENLPSLNLIRNRWGWAINLTSTGITNYQIWSGAGLNKTSNGTFVGTLTVNWDGTTAIVTYILSGNCRMGEVHVYAGDLKPTTTAPGQYGYTAYFDPKAATHSASFEVGDTNGDGIWIIAHAVVCCTP